MCINDLIIFPAYIGIPVDLSPEKLEEKLQGILPEKESTLMTHCSLL